MLHWLLKLYVKTSLWGSNTQVFLLQEVVEAVEVWGVSGICRFLRRGLQYSQLQ